MSYNGSGTFVINTTGQPVVTGTVISSTAFNSLTADLATGLSTAITTDGQSATTVRIPFAAGIDSSLTTDATSVTTGSIITAGGVGIAKALWVGGLANIAGVLTTIAQTITSASANAFAVGRVGTTNPAFNIDASTALSATGVNIKAAAAAGGVAVSVLSSGANEALTVNAKGSGTIGIGSISTGAVTITPATTISGAATLSSTLGVTGAATLSSTLGVTGAATLSSTLGVTGAATLSSTLAVTGALTNSSTLTSTGSVSAPNTFGFKNRIINGAMTTDQRNAGASQTFTAAAALAYSVDRWYGYCTGANVTGQQVAGATTPTNTQFRYRFTGAASVTAVGFAQRIEQKNSYDLAGSTCTLSADLAISATLTTVTWTAYYATTTADTFGSLASPTVTQIATGTFTVGATVTNFSTNISVPAAATTGLQILFTVGALTAGLTWTIGNVQLENGTLATSFDWRPYGTEFALCQRYYEKSYDVDVAPGTASAVGYFRSVVASNSVANTQFYNTAVFKVPKRATPTGFVWGYAGAASTVGNDSGTSIGANSGTVSELSTTRFNVSNQNGGTLTTTGLNVLFQWAAVSKL